MTRRPVGLAAYAASAIAQSDPIRTGIQGFTYDLRTAILPFVFLFNTDLLMIDGVTDSGEIIWIHSFVHIGWIFLVALIAMFSFAAFLQGWFADKCSWGERLILLAVTVVLFRPALVTDWLPLITREMMQAVGVAVFAALYLYQRRRTRAVLATS